MKIKLDNEFCIRDFVKTDVDSLTANANNKKIFDNVRDAFPFPYLKSDAKWWIQYTKTFIPCTHFAIATETECIGGIGLEPQTDVHRFSAEIGFWLGEAYWHRGLMTQALNAMTEYTFKHYQWNRIYAQVYEHNKASMRVLEKCGYIREGILKKAVYKNYRLLDAFIFAKLQQDE